MQIVEVKAKMKNTATPEKYQELVKKLRKEHEKLVKGKFEFTDANGGYLEFSYRFFKDDLLLSKIRLNHGEICEIPMGWVKHLNNTVKKVRVPSMSPSQDGKSVGFFSGVETTSRVRFTPIEFL